MNQIGTEEVSNIATGAAVLGTGGGGDPHLGKLMAQQAIEDHGSITLLDPSDVPDDALIVPTAMMGAPTVSTEKIPRGDESVNSFRAIEDYTNKEVYATMSIEAGGINSTIPLAVAAQLQLPIVDADGMGRAFPEIPQTSLTLGGVDATPFTMADEKGNSMILETIDNTWTETFSRSISVDMGGSAMISCYPHTGKQLKEHAIHNSLTYAEKIGRAINELTDVDSDPVEILVEEFDGYHLHGGKVTDVYRRTSDGFAKGAATIDGTGSFRDTVVQLEFQNEFLIARTEDTVLATVPDLICVIESETGQPVTTEELSYGYRVDVIGFEAADQWRTAEGVKLGGPEFFGYDLEYIPVEQRIKQTKFANPSDKK